MNKCESLPSLDKVDNALTEYAAASLGVSKDNVCIKVNMSDEPVFYAAYFDIEEAAKHSGYVANIGDSAPASSGPIVFAASAGKDEYLAALLPAVLQHYRADIEDDEDLLEIDALCPGFEDVMRDAILSLCKSETPLGVVVDIESVLQRHTRSPIQILHGRFRGKQPGIAKEWRGTVPFLYAPPRKPFTSSTYEHAVALSSMPTLDQQAKQELNALCAKTRPWHSLYASNPGESMYANWEGGFATANDVKKAIDNFVDEEKYTVFAVIVPESPHLRIEAY